MTAHSKVRRVGMLFALLLLLAAVAGLVLASRPPKFPSVVLKDGRVIEVLGTTLGDEHKLKESRVRNLVHALAPNSMKKMLGPNFNASFGFGGDGLGLWLMCFDPATGQYGGGGDLKIVALDEHGCEFEANGNGGTGDGYYSATIYNLSAFPRRQERFVCRISKDVNGKPEVQGEIAVDNPALTRCADWTPEPFPVTKTNGPVAVRLNSYERGTGPNLTILENGQVTPKWELRDATYEDATGNQGQTLCRHEAAWKYRGNLFQNHYGTFSSNEIWTLSKIRLPAPGTLAMAGTTNTIAGTQLKISYLGGAGSYVLSNDVCTSAVAWGPGMSHQVSSMNRKQGGADVKVHTIEFDKPFVVIEHPYLGRDSDLMLRASKDGEVVATGRFSAGLDGKWFYELASLVADRGWETNGLVDVDVIVQRARPIEFFVSPKAETPSGHQ